MKPDRLFDRHCQWVQIHFYPNYCFIAWKDTSVISIELNISDVACNECTQLFFLPPVKLPHPSESWLNKRSVCVCQVNPWHILFATSSGEVNLLHYIPAPSVPPSNSLMDLYTHCWQFAGWSLAFIFKSLQFIVKAERVLLYLHDQPRVSFVLLAGSLSVSLSLTECRWAQPLGLWPTAWPFGWGEINQAINCLQRAIIHPASLLARAPHLQHLSSHLHDVAMLYVSDGFKFKHPQTSTQQAFWY